MISNWKWFKFLDAALIMTAHTCLCETDAQVQPLLA